MPRAHVQMTPDAVTTNRVAALTTWLGWGAPLECTLSDTQDGISRETSVYWYQCKKSDGTWLQVNFAPVGQFQTVSAAVYAIRYRICTGFHVVPDGMPGQWKSVERRRVRRYLSRHHVTSRRGRSRFRRANPECYGWTWPRLRGVKLPHDV